ncbi:MAG: type II secretion system protein [Cyanobacteria bacterium SIG31]|nr:type II secretion system protein [Cyanobacteria bacterium SIG31]
MMKKFGFTLAEVLITLGIVGVIAAMTIPTFVTNSQNKANAAKLASTISNIENAFGIMMVQEGANTLDETEFYQYLTNKDLEKAESTFGEYLKLQGNGTVTNFYGEDKPFKYIGYSAVPENITLSESIDVYQTKNGALLMFADGFNEITEDVAKKYGISVTKQYFLLRIDVNGKENPNIIGRDVFVFALCEDGALYPFGGKTSSVIQTGNPTSRHYKNSSGSYACIDGKFSAGCTARLIENNFVVDY